MTCVTCGPGQFSLPASLTPCVNCSAGTYSIGTSCPQCVAGTYSGAGASGCLPCPNGTSSNAGAAFCHAPYACGPGTYGSPGSCVNCPVDYYNPKSNATSFSACQPCASGSYNSEAGQSSCGGSCPTSCASNLYQASCVSPSLSCSCSGYAVTACENTYNCATWGVNKCTCYGAYIGCLENAGCNEVTGNTVPMTGAKTGCTDANCDSCSSGSLNSFSFVLILVITSLLFLKEYSS